MPLCSNRNDKRGNTSCFQFKSPRYTIVVLGSSYLSQVLKMYLMKIGIGTRNCFNTDIVFCTYSKHTKKLSIYIYFLVLSRNMRAFFFQKTAKLPCLLYKKRIFIWRILETLLRNCSPFKKNIISVMLPVLVSGWAISHLSVNKICQEAISFLPRNICVSVSWCVFVFMHQWHLVVHARFSYHTFLPLWTHTFLQYKMDTSADNVNTLTFTRRDFV